jgi:putative membrane protein
MNDYDELTCPIYLITGFLDSGKTSFINFTVGQEYFEIDGLTLLLICEQGEEEYERKYLLDHNTVPVIIENKEDLTLEKLNALRRKFRPERVLIEYNPFWGMKDIEVMEMPDGWGIVQEIVLADASTFLVYMNNMKSLFMDMARNADMITFNRCTQELPLANFRRSVKVVNPACEILFEDVNGDVLDIFENALPYDPDADIINIEDEDYGIFFVDARDNPDRYDGKIVRIHGQVYKSRDPKADVFVPGRMAMTCCAEDMQFIGFLCKSKQARRLEAGSWVTVTAEMRFERAREYNDEVGPVLYATKIEDAEPSAMEWVAFT